MPSPPTLRPLLAVAALSIATALALPDAFLIDCANGRPSCDSYMKATAPPNYSVVFTTTAGEFTIKVETALAVPMATRFYVLSTLGYPSGGPFYRVLNINSTQRFVAQMGYRGIPTVDQAWLQKQTSNTTAAVSLSNVRGTVVFGTNEVVNNGQNPDCAALLCSQGFSVELFVNLADNPSLDRSDFSPFGTIDQAGMAVVDRLYSGYGECADECQSAGDGDPYCVRDPATGRWAGVNLSEMLDLGGGGKPYLANFPLLDWVTDVKVVEG